MYCIIIINIIINVRGQLMATLFIEAGIEVCYRDIDIDCLEPREEALYFLELESVD